jgi:hypothetical protein
MTATSHPLARSLCAAAVAACAPFALAAPPTTAGTWQRIDSPAPVVGIDGKTHAAQCSGYPGTDPSFRFWARKGSSKNLVVYFEGGGACWDNLTCTFPIAGLPSSVPQFFVPQVPPGLDPAAIDGIFRTDNAANPVRDWNMVYIPYCTADIHTGTATANYTSVGNPALGVAPNVPITIQHRGFDNFMVVLDWMRKNIDKPKNVLVTGVSAGGYGATVNSPWVGRAFPQAHLYVLADASQGVTTPAFDAGTPGRGSWNPQFASWVFGNDIASVPGGEVMRRAAQGQRHAKVAQFTTSFDGVQIGFYGVMKQFYGPGGSCPNPAIDWYQQMSKQLIADGNEVGNYRYYVAGGTYHTLLRDPTFYSESSAGPTFAQWLGGMLANRGGTNGVGGQWFNAACPTCLVDLPCQ